VLLVGEDALTGKVERALGAAEVSVQRYASHDLALSAVSDATQAVLVASASWGSQETRFCGKLRRRSPELPVFATCHAVSTRAASGIYEAGANGLFFWPADRAPLARTLYRVSGRALTTGNRKSTAGEVALEEVALQRLKTDATSFGRRLRVRARGRYLLLLGHVDALWKVHVAERVLTEVEGAEDVFTEGLRVAGRAPGDKQVAKAIRQVLEYTGSVRTEAVVVTASSGEATLSGRVRSAEERDRILALAREVRGIKKVVDRLEVKPRGTVTPRAVAKSVVEAVRTHSPKGGIEVSVFGNLVVLSGRVSTAAARRRLLELAARQPGVRRVVDKMRVTGKPARR